MAKTNSLPHDISHSPPTFPRFLETENNDGIRERLLRLVLEDKTDVAPTTYSYTSGEGSQTDEINSGLPVKNLCSEPVSFPDQPSREDIRKMIRATEVYIERELFSGDIRAVVWHLKYGKGPVGVYLRHFARKHKGSTFKTIMKDAEMCSKNSTLQPGSSDDKIDDQKSEHGKGLSLKTDESETLFVSFSDGMLDQMSIYKMRAVEEYVQSQLGAGNVHQLMLFSKHDEGPVGEYIRHLLQKSRD